MQGRKRFMRKWSPEKLVMKQKRRRRKLWTSCHTWIQNIAMLQLPRVTTCLERLLCKDAKDSRENEGKNLSMNQKKENDANLWTSSPTWIQKIAMLQLMRITTCLELVQGRAKDSWENGGKTCHEQKQEKRFVNFLLLLESTKSSSYASINSHNNLLELMQGREIFVSKWRKTYHEQNKRKNCVLSSPTWIHKNNRHASINWHNNLLQLVQGRERLCEKMEI